MYLWTYPHETLPQVIIMKWKSRYRMRAADMLSYILQQKQKNLHILSSIIIQNFRTLYCLFHLRSSQDHLLTLLGLDIIRVKWQLGESFIEICQLIEKLLGHITERGAGLYLHQHSENGEGCVDAVSSNNRTAILVWWEPLQILDITVVCNRQERANTKPIWPHVSTKVNGELKGCGTKMCSRRPVSLRACTVAPRNKDRTSKQKHCNSYNKSAELSLNF